jgi:hypothetical protein
MAAVPISRSSAIAAMLRGPRPDRGPVSITVAALVFVALIRVTGFANDTSPAQDLPQASRLTNFLRQLPGPRVTAAADSPTRGTCVMTLAGNGKLSVGFGDPQRDVMVSLSACDLYNASRDPHSTELVGRATLSARNIFLSGDYALEPGTIMTASKYLATHASAAVNPYARLEVPGYSECTRNQYRLDAQKAETISPGIYCGGIEVAGGATLNLAPGTYILDRGDFAVSGNSTVNGAGVTLILTSRNGQNYGTVDIRGGSTIRISAPVSTASAGIPGIAIWVDAHAPAAGATIEGGNTQTIDGAVYLPSRRVHYSGGSPSGTRCSQLVALAIAFTGNSYFRHDCAGAGVSDPEAPSLLLE